MTLKEFVNTLSYNEAKQCVENYTEFEEKGIIGTCTLRTKAEEYMKATKLSDDCVEQTMERSVFYICNRITKEYFEITDELIEKLLDKYYIA